MRREKLEHVVSKLEIFIQDRQRQEMKNSLHFVMTWKDVSTPTDAHCWRGQDLVKHPRPLPLGRHLMAYDFGVAP